MPVQNRAPSVGGVVNNQGVPLPNYDGFSVVYKHSNSGSMGTSDYNGNGFVDLFV